MWQKIEDSNYSYMFETDDFNIYPKDKNGKTRVVAVKRRLFHFKHNTTGEIITFKFYLHQKQWYWSDSRMAKGNCGEQHVMTEIARIAFKKNENTARSMVRSLFMSSV